MDEGKKYSVSKRVPKDAPQEYFNYAMNSVRREMGNNMVETLLSGRLPAVVDLTEEVVDTYDAFVPGLMSEFRISIRVNPVQYKHFTTAVFDGDYSIPYDYDKVKRLQVQLAYMALGFLSLLSIIVWFIFR